MSNRMASTGSDAVARAATDRGVAASAAVTRRGAARCDDDAHGRADGEAARLVIFFADVCSVASSFDLKRS